MNDKISIQGLQVPTVIGVLAYERVIKQTLLLDMEFGIDAAIPAQEDDLQQTVDYDALCTYVREFGLDNDFQLIETFAEKLASTLLEHFPIQDIKLTVNKPTAVKEAKNISVSIERKLA